MKKIRVAFTPFEPRWRLLVQVAGLIALSGCMHSPPISPITPVVKLGQENVEPAINPSSFSAPARKELLIPSSAPSRFDQPEAWLADGQCFEVMGKVGGVELSFLNDGRGLANLWYESDVEYLRTYTHRSMGVALEPFRWQMTDMNVHLQFADEDLPERYELVHIGEHETYLIPTHLSAVVERLLRARDDKILTETLWDYLDGIPKRMQDPFIDLWLAQHFTLKHTTEALHSPMKKQLFASGEFDDYLPAATGVAPPSRYQGNWDPSRAFSLSFGNADSVLTFFNEGDGLLEIYTRAGDTKEFKWTAKGGAVRISFPESDSGLPGEFRHAKLAGGEYLIPLDGFEAVTKKLERNEDLGKRWITEQQVLKRKAWSPYSVTETYFDFPEIPPTRPFE